MSERFRYLSPKQASTIRQWWRALNRDRDGALQDGAAGGFPAFDRGHRARLRRAASLAEMQEETAVYLLRDRLGALGSPALERDDQHWLFLVAGAVALVDKDAGPPEPGGKAAPGYPQSLAARLSKAAAAPGSDSAPMSEERFKRLLRAKAPEEFFLQLRRALQLVPGRRVDTTVLADDLLAWSAERNDVVQRANAVRFRWARDYFLSRKDLNLATSEDEPASINPDLAPENLA